MIDPGPEMLLAQKQTEQIIDSLLGELREKERTVIRLRFGFDGEPKTLREIGEQIGNAHERVRQIEAKALRLLKHPSRSRRLRHAWLSAPEYERWTAPVRRPPSKPMFSESELVELEGLVKGWHLSPHFAEWIKQILADPRINEVKPWDPMDFRWPYGVGMTPGEAVEFAVAIDTAPDAAARARVFAIAELKFHK